jgi:carbonic anhydrase
MLLFNSVLLHLLVSRKAMLTLSVTQVALRSSGFRYFTSHPDATSRKEALRSIVISQRLLGTREIAVFHHTGCGMLTFTTPQLRDIVKKAHPGDEGVAKEVDSIDFLEFPHLEESVKSDVKHLEDNPLVLKETTITGWIYEVETGKVSFDSKVTAY